MLTLATFSVISAQDKNRKDNDQDRRNACDRRLFDTPFDNGDRNKDLRIIGLTADGRLVCFDEDRPWDARILGTVAGLTGADTALIGIDYRVQDGNLYGVGNGGGVYSINPSTATASFVNALSIALDGTTFGVDFNPAADRLRIVSNTGQNLRHNVNTGGVTLNDGTLTYTAPPTAPVAALGLISSAYTNNDLDANTATTLFNIDSTLDQVVLQSPANNGILVATGKLTLDVSGRIGFDIYSTLNSGVTTGVEGFASLTSAVDGITRLYYVELLTGKVTLRGAFRSQLQVVDIAIPLNQ